MDNIQFIHNLEVKPCNNNNIAMVTRVEPDILTDTSATSQPDLVIGSTIESQAPTVMAQPVPIISIASKKEASSPSVLQSVPPIKDSNPTPEPVVEVPTEANSSPVRLGRDSCHVDCPSCNKDIFTNGEDLDKECPSCHRIIIPASKPSKKKKRRRQLSSLQLF